MEIELSIHSWDPGGPGGGPPRLLSSRESIHPLSVYGQLSLEHRLRFGLNGKMEHLTTHLHRPRTTRSPLSFWGDGGIVPFEPFFHAGGLKKAAINRISRILPSRKEEREILFPFRRDQEIGSSHNIRRMLGINNSLLGFRPPQSLRALPDQCNGMYLFIYLLTRNGAGLKKDLRVSRVGPGGSLNAFFFLPIGVISQRLAMVREKGEQAHLKSAVQWRVVCCVREG